MRQYRVHGYWTFQEMYRQMQCDILTQPLISVGQWQSQETDIKTRELMGVVLEYRLPRGLDELQDEVMPNLSWAEDHFQERVSSIPLNPPPSEKWWPFNQDANAAHKMQKDGTVAKFSHTYPERFWPKYAGGERLDPVWGRNIGIRFELGDLRDLVELLRRAPGTRQAYLPVWFPEDTGTVHGGRVPCSLGYHFLIRGGQLHCWYSMRSCDLLRHFPDDVYMAGRLVQWICEELNAEPVTEEIRETSPAFLTPGVLTMTISSLHVFETDDYMLSQQVGYRPPSGRRR